MAIKDYIRRHALAAYFILAFGIAWLGILAVVAPTGIPDDGTNAARLMPLVFLAMIAGPSLASLLLTALLDGKAGLRDLGLRLGRWRVAPGWYAVALLTTPLLLVAILGALALVAPAYLPGVIAASDKTGVVVFAVVAGLGAGFFEELGWTGFATPRLLAGRRNPLTVGIAFGAVWMSWHLLADYWWGGLATDGQLYLAHVLLWFVAFMAYRALMTWVYSHTGSLLLGMLMHASFTGGQALFGPVATTAVEGLLWYALFALVLWVVVGVAALLEARRPAPRPSPVPTV
jgi:uncharacterized protein